MKIYITNKTGTHNITEYVGTVTLSGDYQLCARQLDFNIVSNALDKNLKVIDCELGSGVMLTENGQVIFNGFIFQRDKSTDDSLIDITCFDRGIYLKRNKGVYNVSSTAEAITKRICTDFGINVGKLATTGVNIKRKFIGVSLLDIIQTMYSIASETTGKKYVLRFENDKLCVVERNETAVLYLDGNVNLMSSVTSESASSMVNQVAIYDDKNKLINTLKNNDNISKFGLFQEYLKKGKDDVNKKAKQMLEDGGIQQKITVSNIGNINCISGNSLTVKEPYTGVCGLFYIDSDVHTWKGGQYYNKLTLNFKKIMSNKTSGSDS